MRISDWSSDVCSSDLVAQLQRVIVADRAVGQLNIERAALVLDGKVEPGALAEGEEHRQPDRAPQAEIDQGARAEQRLADRRRDPARLFGRGIVERAIVDQPARSEEHTSELQSLMRISYAVFCLKKKKKNTIQN